MSYNSIKPTLSILLDMQETTGTTAFDSSGNGRDATINGMGANPVTATGPGGHLASAFDFNGTSHYVLSPSNTFLSATGFSVFGWRKQDTTTGVQEYIGSDQSAIGTRQLQFRGNGSSVEFIRFNPSVIVVSKLSATVADTWDFVFGRFDNSSGSIASKNDGATPGTDVSTVDNNSVIQALFFGARSPNGSSTDTYLDGKLAGMGVAPYPLTDPEFQEIRFGPEPINTVPGTLGADGSYDVGTWDSQGNGTITYEWVAVNLAGSVIDSGTGSSGTADISAEAGNTVYFLVRASNDGGYDKGDEATRTSGYGIPDDGYYELALMSVENGLTLTNSFSPVSQIASGAVARTQNAVFACDFTGLVGSSGGLIYEQGAVANGSYVGFRANGDFVVRSGTGGTPWQVTTAYLLVPAASAPSGSGTLVWEFAVGTPGTVRAWWNGSELTGTGQSANFNSWAGSDAGGYFLKSASIVIGEFTTAVPYATASDLRYYQNQLVIGAGGGGSSITCDQQSYTLSAQNAGLIIDRSIFTDQQSYSASDQSVNISKGLYLSGNQQLYSLTTQDSLLVVDKNLVIDQSDYSMSGQDATITVGKTVAAAQQSYALTTQDAGLLIGKTVAAAQQSYVLTTQGAGLLVGKIVAASQQSYILTAQDANLASAGSLVADQQSYNLTTQTASLLVDRSILSSQQSYSLTAQTAGLFVDKSTTAAQQSYTLSNQSAGLIADRSVSASQQSYILTTQSAGFSLQGSLAAIQQSYVVSAQSAGLLVGRSLSANQQTYTLTAQNAVLNTISSFAIDQQSYVVTAQGVGLLIDRSLSASQQAYTLTAQDAGLNSGAILAANGQAYTLSTSAVGFRKDYRLSAASQTYSAATQAANISVSRKLVTSQASYISELEDCMLLVDRLLSANNANVSLTGIASDLLANRLINLENSVYSISGDSALITGRLLSAQMRDLNISSADQFLLAGRLISLESTDYIASWQNVRFNATNRNNGFYYYYMMLSNNE